MVPKLSGRLSHYLLLILVAAVLFLPNLGAASLWDVDEGHNAECSAEMLRCGNWVLPTFNYALRTDKPALLYWLQIFAYQLFGISEFAARLPCALAALLTVLVAYELGRSMFDAATGLLAGVILGSTMLFCGSAHFANPDALLNAATAATFFLFWRSFRKADASWPILVGVTVGLGFLAKGPVALVLPLTVVGLYLLWVRQVRRLLDGQFLLAGVVSVLIAGPWFALVGAETKGEFIRQFFLKHNFGRYTEAMEGHRGHFYYHALSLLVGFLPWSAFLVPALRKAFKGIKVPAEELRPSGGRSTGFPFRFLLCWVGVYFVFFSVSQTKLPNYILPLYPPLALLTARFLQRWRRGETNNDPGMRISFACWALLGIGTTAGLLVASGTIDVSWIRGRRWPGLEEGAVLGTLPLLGAVAAWLASRRQARTDALVALTASGVLFTAALAAWAAPAMNPFKAPQALVEVSEARQTQREVRIGCFDWWEPSVVFYSGREVELIRELPTALELLRWPLPAYLFVPAATWERMEPWVGGPHRIVARHWDLYRRCEVVVVTNQE